jgi:hypothetical protein
MKYFAFLFRQLSFLAIIFSVLLGCKPQTTVISTINNETLTIINQFQTPINDTPTIQLFTEIIPTSTILLETPTPNINTDNWKIYRSNKFGFVFKYPPDFQNSSSGPNDAQKSLNRGEEISGTAAPSLDTITFISSLKRQQFTVVIFPVREDKVSPAGFNDGYLGFGSDCDIRWIDSIIEKPTLFIVNGISILKVQVHHYPDVGPLGYAGCLFLKNSIGNLIVFNVSGFDQKSEFLSFFMLVGDGIISTIFLN